MIDIGSISEVEARGQLKSYKQAICEICQSESDILHCPKHDRYFCRNCLSETVIINYGKAINKEFKAKCTRKGDCNYFPLGSNVSRLY